ncbi:MAG: response regulator [Deltaproteobacteria bacterium]|nr:response regulator [Deltaproteobacteria bacterium]
MPPTDERPGAGRVLVVDDQEDLCWVLRRLLEARGHVVATAPSAARARALFAELEAQVAVVDYRLPDGCGLDLAQELMLAPGAPRCILMTSYGNAALRARAAELGMFAYLDKPFANEAAVDCIERAMTGSFIS